MHAKLFCEWVFKCCIRHWKKGLKWNAWLDLVCDWESWGIWIRILLVFSRTLPLSPSLSISLSPITFSHSFWLVNNISISIQLTHIFMAICVCVFGHVWGAGYVMQIMNSKRADFDKLAWPFVWLGCISQSQSQSSRWALAAAGVHWLKIKLANASTNCQLTVNWRLWHVASVASG